jgi:hypothetical protein
MYVGVNDDYHLLNQPKKFGAFENIGFHGGNMST